MDLTHREVVSRGGKKSAENMTPEQRKERASKASKARWDRYYEAKKVRDDLRK